MVAMAPVTGSKSRQEKGRKLSIVSVPFNKKVKDFPETPPRHFFFTYHQPELYRLAIHSVKRDSKSKYAAFPAFTVEARKGEGDWGQV